MDIFTKLVINWYNRIENIETSLEISIYISITFIRNFNWIFNFKKFIFNQKNVAKDTITGKLSPLIHPYKHCNVGEILPPTI